MKDTTTNRTNSNPFEFASNSAAPSQAHKLDYTPALISLSNNRAAELMIHVSKHPDLHALANSAIDSGDVDDLIDLINAVYNGETINTDAAVLDGCDDDQLARLLESRRSDRSKAKAKDLRSSHAICMTYISSMYAELLVRVKTGKPYSGTSSSTKDLDESDLKAVTARIKSLQSKQSRLNKLAQYDAAAAEELKSVKAEIARLNALRPGTRVVTQTTIKDVNVDTIRAALKQVKLEDLSEEQLAQYEDLMAKLG